MLQVVQFLGIYYRKQILARDMARKFLPFVKSCFFSSANPFYLYNPTNATIIQLDCFTQQRG